jgi:FAD/FMN-containing dehydrogenase
MMTEHAPAAVVTVGASRPADVRQAIIAARERELPFAVRATGHGTHASTEGTLLLDTSGMSSVLVDPDRRVARVGPGAVWGDVLAAAAPFGLAPLSGSSPSVGVTGFTLGGGVGWLSRRYGFAADGVVRADVVTADGEVLTASRDQHPDLFWALRGGGGNFGVVTALEFELHPVASVYAGTSYFPVERAAETLARYRHWIETAPDELSTAILLTRIPELPEVPEPLRGRPALAIRALHAGEPAEAERLLAPLRQAAGPALHEGLRRATYAKTEMGGTPPRHLELLEAVPDRLIGLLVEAFEDETSPVSTVELRHWGGAMARPPANAGPVGHRGVPFSVIVDTPDVALAIALRPYATGGSFLNFLSDTRRTADAYTAADYRQLTEIKASYDPDNVFSFGHSLEPAQARAVAA